MLVAKLRASTLNFPYEQNQRKENQAGHKQMSARKEATGSPLTPSNAIDNPSLVLMLEDKNE